MHRLALLGTVVLAMSVTAPAFAAKHHRHVRHAHPVQVRQSYVVPAYASPAFAAPAYAAPVRTIGPPWAGPNQCWTDEGYGRYAPCDGGGKAM